MSQSPAASDPWDRYWDHGNLHSFSQVVDGNYDGPIAAFWQEHLAGLEDGESIVDIATGNGAVALLALEQADAQGRDVTVHGTDLAHIDPGSRLADESLRSAVQRIRFHPGTPAESLPFAAGSIDRVCSQFGLEYSRLGESVPEIARVLRPGGRAALIVHHNASAAVESAAAEAAALAHVLDEARLYLKARNLLRALPGRRDLRNPERGSLPPKAAKKHRTVEQALDAIEARAQASPHPRMLRGPTNYVREVLAMTAQVGPTQALKWLEEARQRCVAMRERLGAMQAAAHGEDAIRDLADAFSAAGLDRPSPAILRDTSGTPLGWCLQARRPNN